MMEIKLHRKKLWIRFVLLLTILAISVTSVIFIIRYYSKPSTNSNDSVSKTSIITVKPQTISSNVMFTGNIFWGRYINDWSMASDLKTAYPFSRLNEFNRDQYDAWITGLECPLVAGLDISSADMDATLAFNCSPDYLPEASKWFTAVTLANNHTDNQGVDGFEETKQHLEENKIQYFGHYDYASTSDACEIISLPVTIANDDESITKGNLPVAMCGYHGVFGVPTNDAIAEMQKYSSLMPVIAMPHMGAEYKTSPDEIKIDFYHRLIDGGADMVLGDHPHWIQNTESYNGHLIVYSMGNFIFDQQDTVEVVRSAAIRVVMKTTDTDSELLKKWLDIGENCSSFKDSCLAMIQEQGLTKLSINYQFGAIGTNDGDRINKPADSDQQNSILERLNWQSTMGQLMAPYSSL